MKMSVGKPFILGLALLVGSAPLSLANEKPISSVRKAAIERMQEKLGGLRGSIAPQDRIIMLTNRLLDMQKPVRHSTRVRGSRGFDTVTTGGILPIDPGGNLHSPERKGVHGGFTFAAGTVPAGPDEDDYAEAAADMIDDHGLEPLSF